LRQQTAAVAGRSFRFASGERIHVEHSYKYTIDQFQTLARLAGFEPEAVYTDPGGLFSVHYLATG
jgi:L-histidine N-alpha-methyltransferase